MADKLLDFFHLPLSRSTGKYLLPWWYSHWQRVKRPTDWTVRNGEHRRWWWSSCFIRHHDRITQSDVRLFTKGSALARVRYTRSAIVFENPADAILWRLTHE